MNATYYEALDASIAGKDMTYLIEHVFAPCLRGFTFRELCERDAELMQTEDSCRHHRIQRQAINFVIAERVNAKLAQEFPSIA